MLDANVTTGDSSLKRLGSSPVTLNEFSQRLKRGETFKVQTSDGLDYRLFLDAEKYVIFQKGDQVLRYRRIEVALFTLLNRLGEFNPPDAEVDHPAHDKREGE